MLERQFAVLLAKYLSRFVEDVNPEKLEVSLWSGNVVLSNVHLRADVMERITALLHGDAAIVDNTSTNFAGETKGSSSSPNAATTAQAAAPVCMLLAPLTVVKGIIRHLTIRVPWSSLDSEPIHVQVSGVELVLGPLRARPFNAWEEQEREEVIKQQQLKRYEEERQRLTRGMASALTSRSSSGQQAGSDASSNKKVAAADDAAEDSNAPWLSWILDFDRIGQIAVRNVCLTLNDVCLRYEFDYVGLHPSLSKAFTIFVHEMRLTTTNQFFCEFFVNDLLAPLCKRILLSDIIVSVHAIRVPQQSSVEPDSPQGSSLWRPYSSLKTSQDDVNVLPSPLPNDFSDAATSSLRPAKTGKSVYETYRDQWRFSKAILEVSSVELRAKIVSPGCVSLNPIVEQTLLLSASSMELTVAAVEGVRADLCFGVLQTLESMWRSYHQSLGCARYRKRLHLLKVHRQRLPQLHLSEAAPDVTVEGEPSRSGDSSPFPLASEVFSSQQLAWKRWKFALRCVLDDIQQQRETFHQHERSRREVIEGTMKFCQVRRSYCQYWKRMQGVPWTPPLSTLEEKKLMLMERQLSLTQVIFLRCLSYAEILQEEYGHARQRMYIEEARQRHQKDVGRSGNQTDEGGASGGRGKQGNNGFWGWLTGKASTNLEKESHKIDSVSDTKDKARALAIPPSLQTLSLSELLAAEWAVGERYTSPHRAPPVQPSVPQHLLPQTTGGSCLYLTARCVVETLSVRIDPTYWPLVHDSSVPPPPPNTPLRRIQQQFCVVLSALEVFFTTVPSDHPDKASWSFFIGSARLFFDGILRSVLLQSKEAEGEDFIVVKQNACRAHIGVWVSPQLVICQPLHEWHWWGTEVAAFLEWFRVLRQTFYAPATPPPLHTAPLTRPPSPSSSAAALMWNITLQATDVCVPLSARDITDADLAIIDHQPSGLSSLAMMDSANTAVPVNSTSLGADTHRRFFLDDGHASLEMEHLARSPVTPTRSGARSKGALRAFRYANGQAEGKEEDENDEERSGNSNSSPLGATGSFASTKPERCFLNNDTCLVLSISTACLFTVPPSRRRHQGDGNEYYLCIGDPERAVRLFYQKGVSPALLASNWQSELMSFAVGEVLLNPRELSLVFNKGIDFVVEPDAFAALNDNLLNPSVFVANNAGARQVQAIVEDLRTVDANAKDECDSLILHNRQLPPLSWRLRSPGCMEIRSKTDNETDQTGGGIAHVVMREFPADCARHILAVVTPNLPKEGREKTWKEGEAAAAMASAAHDTLRGNTHSTQSNYIFGRRTIALGISVARLLVRSACNEDIAEVVLVAPEEVPAVTTPYRSSLAALGAQEPRAVELLWDPSSQQRQQPRMTVEETLCGELRDPLVGQNGCPSFLLFVPDMTMTTEAGQKLLTVEHLTILQEANAPGASEDVAVTAEDASVYFDMVLVDLMETAVGVFYALRPICPPPRSTMNEMQPATTESAALSFLQPQHEKSNVIEAPMLSLHLRVRSVHLQAPLTKSDVEGAPYVDINAQLDSFATSFEPLPRDDNPQRGVHGWRLRVEFDVANATQLVDYIGGDPETRNLVTALPWAAHEEGNDNAARPMHCAVGITVSGIPHTKNSGPATEVLTTTTCRIDVRGGAIHAYFPFLYLIADVLTKDERIRRLGRLPPSPLFKRGFTSSSCAFMRSKNGTRFPAHRVPENCESISGTPSAVSSPPSLTPSSFCQMDITATLSDVDVFLATDAAVPIDVRNPDTLCAVHITELNAGLKQTAAQTTTDPTSFVQLRTHAYLDTVSLHLVDLIAPQSQHVRLPNLKICARTGVLLVPKDTLVGYMYQRSNKEDMSVLIGLHAPPIAEAVEQQDSNNTRSDTTTHEESNTTAGVSVGLADYQCRTFIRFLVRNAAQAPVAAAQEGEAWDAYEEAAHLLHFRNQYPMRARWSTASSTDDLTEQKSPPLTTVVTSAARTVLITLPPVSLVLRTEDTTTTTLESADIAVHAKQGVSYEFSLRGAQLYSASGGQWSDSPVKNGQISGLELNAREESMHISASAVPSTLPVSHMQSLFTADLVGAALVEGKSSSITQEHAQGGEEKHTEKLATNSVSRSLTEVVAAVHNATVRVPHMRWWLRLCMLFADSARPTQLGYAPQATFSAPVSLQESFFVVDHNSPPRFCDNLNSQRSSDVFGPHGSNRGSLTTSQSPRWLYGSVKFSHTQVTLGEGDSGYGQQQQQRQAWCHLHIPDACLTIAPVPSPQSGGMSCVYDEFTLDVFQCPEVLLRAADMNAEERSATDSKVVYVSVLKSQPIATTGTGAEGSATSASSAPSCIKVQLIRSPHSCLVSNLRYGRSYHIMDLTLHRTSALQMQINGLLLNAPAKELFGFAQELLRQSDEVRALILHTNGLLWPTPLRSAGPTRTYTGVEAQLNNVGVILSTDSPYTLSGGTKGSERRQIKDSDLPWCGVTVASIRLTTHVELEDVLTSTGDPATLLDDALVVGWRMQVWHLVSKTTLCGVMLAGHHGEDAQWKLPLLKLTVSQPLPRTAICVRANRYTAAADEGSHQPSEPPSFALRQPSPTDFYEVEPTSADLYNKVNNPLLTRAMIEVGDAEKKADDEAAAKHAGATSAPPVVISVGTVYTLSRSVTHLLDLWRVATQREVLFSSSPPYVTAGSVSSPLDKSPGPIVWYEVKLAVRGKHVHLVSDIPENAAYASSRHCLMAIAVEDVIVFQADRELDGHAFVCATPHIDEEEEEETDDSVTDTDATTTMAVLHDRYRVLMGTVRVFDSAGNLICLLSRGDDEAGSELYALTAEYALNERAVSVLANHVLLCASRVTSAFVEEWLRAYETWIHLWWQQARPAEKQKKTEHDAEPSTFVQMLMEVRQVEVLLAPVGYFVIKSLHLNRGLCAPEEPSNSGAVAEEVREVRCDTISLFSTSAVRCRSSQQKRSPELLACVTSPLLHNTHHAGTSATDFRVLNASLYNRDRHSWALCAMRATTVVRSMVALWASLPQRMGSSVSLSPPKDKDDTQREAHHDNSASVAPLSSALSTYQLVVGNLELLCFAPQNEHTATVPWLHIRAVQVEVTASAIDKVTSAPPTATETVKKQIQAQGKLSAAFHSSSNAKMLPLMEETEMTFAVLTGLMEEDKASTEAESEIRFQVEERGVQLHIPTNESLELAAGALCMVFGQRVPRRLPKVASTQHSAEDTVVGSNKGNRSSDVSARRKGGRGEVQKRWCLSASVPRVSVDAILSPKGQRLAIIDVRNLYGELRPRGHGQKPYVEVRVSEATCETDVTEETLKEETEATAAACVMSMKPLTNTQSRSSTATLSSDWKAVPTEMQQFAFFLQQRSLALSYYNQEDHSSVSHNHDDEATALTVRLHLFHAHVTLTFMRAVASTVLRPIACGVRLASSSEVKEAVLNSFYATVLQVRSPNTPLPILGELEQHAALVRVVEVTSSWTLTHDLVLGGTMDSCSLQLHFCNKGLQSVITVRGDPTASRKGEIVVHLACCQSVNGELSPAIRVDADLTVKFENVRVVVDGKGELRTLQPDAFVTLGERSLCVFPSTPPQLPIVAQMIDEASLSKEADSVVQTGIDAASAQGAAPWFATSMYSIDLKVGFDTSLSAQRRCLRATGTWQVSYRFEDKRWGPQIIRSEREGRATLTLQHCMNESAPLTSTPVVFAARLGHASDQNNQLKFTLDVGTMIWQLPLAHAQLLVLLAKSILDACTKPLSTSAEFSQLLTPSAGKNSASATPWMPPASLSTQKASKDKVATLSKSSSPLDVECDIPLLIWYLTDDLQLPLAAYKMKKFSFRSTCNVELTDAVLTVAASLSVTDCLTHCTLPNHSYNTKNGGGSCTTATAAETSPEQEQRRAAATDTTRLLFAAQPSMTLVWTRFTSDSRSLSLSVNVDDVVATVPIITALRVWRRLRTDADAGTRAFWNDTGVEFSVSAADASADTLGQSIHTSRSDGSTEWRVPTSPSSSGTPVVTGIPSSLAELTLTLQASPVGAPLSTSSTDHSGVSHNAPVSATLDLRKLEHSAVHRLRLPTYASPFGALDLVVSKCVREGVAAVHLATTVALTNVFYSLDDTGDSSFVVVLRSSSVNDTSAFVVGPRSTRFVPLPVLQDQFRLEMGGFVYAAQAKLLTWAMIADAFTTMADQIAASTSTAHASASAAGTVAANLLKLDAEAENNESKSGGGGSRGKRGVALCGGRHFRMVDSSTISFPVVLRPQSPSVSSSAETFSSLADAGNTTADSAASAPRTNRIVQFTWKRHCSQQQQQLLSLGQLPLCEYMVKVEPVWTLWNCTGCRLRLSLQVLLNGTITSKKATSAQDAAAAVQHEIHGRTSPSLESPTIQSTQTGAGSIILSTLVEDGACFQWVPTSLRQLEEDIAVFFQIESPCPSSQVQWWSAAAPLLLKEPPPDYIRLQQSTTHAYGAVSLTQNGSSTVVVRCAALLRSNVSQPVYLRDASRPMPLLGTDAQGCLRPRELLPLFFSEYVTAPTPNAKRVGFTVRDRPLRTMSVEEKEETNAYYLTSPIAATVLSADEREDYTIFYTVLTDGDAGAELAASASATETSFDAPLWCPAATEILQLRSLCSIHNSDPNRTLFVRPYVGEYGSPVTEETCIPPGEEREVLRFTAHAEEPEVHFCYSENASLVHAHMWSPPVKLLSLATSTLPLILNHICTPSASTTETRGTTFRLFPVPRGRHEFQFSTWKHCRCLALQSSTDDGRLYVSVSLHAAPPLRIINRLSTTLQFSQLLTENNESKTLSPASAVNVTADGVSTALCSSANLPCSYLVAAETKNFGGWEVPTLGSQRVRITLHSNRRKGFTASVDVDLLKCAAAPSSGLRVGQTDAYVYVSLEHLTHQYTVTVVPTRQLESRMLFQPRRLTQVEVFVPRCTVYVASVTIPAAGPFSRASVIARGARGRLRMRSGVDGAAGATVPIGATDEDVLSILRRLEIDLVCIRVVGVYGSVTMTERHVLGNASVGIVEVVDATTPEAVYPVVFRMSSSRPQRSEGQSRSEDLISAKGDPATSAMPTNSASGDSASFPPPSSTIGVAVAATGVPHFTDPSWCNVEVQLTLSDGIHGGCTVMLPFQLLRISVPPMTVHLHDEFLFTVRAFVERIREEWTFESFAVEPQESVPRSPSLSATKMSKDILSEAAQTVSVARRSNTKTVCNVFLYELYISALATEVTYTRSGDWHYNPFRNVGVLLSHLIPSMEGLDIKLKEVRLANVELLSVTSFAQVVHSFVWPLYRTQLLLQSYKVVGSLDALGNPRALLGSWSRGVWDLVKNSSGKSGWAGTRDFLRTATSSTLHSVGVLARSIGNLTGGFSTAVTGVTTTVNSGSGEGGQPLTTGQRRSVLSEVFAEVSGGVADVMTKPIRGAREGGVNGFFVGVASGMAQLVGRPMFGLFRGVSVTAEFYARILDGHTTLTRDEARRLVLERNYRLFADPNGSEDTKATMQSALTLPPTAATPVATEHRGDVLLSSMTFEKMMSDVLRWGRRDGKTVRIAVTRAGVQSTALFLPYASVTAFFTPEEFVTSLPTSLTALLAGKLLLTLAHDRRNSGAAPSEEGPDREARLARLARECDHATHIKVSLGVSALHKYVSESVFARVCSLPEIVESVTAADLQANYVILLAKTISAAGDELCVPH